MKRPFIDIRFLGVVIVICGIIGGALAQSPSVREENRSGEAPGRNYAKPTNLRVLPKNTSGEELNRLMHGYERQLGVPCGYCHDEDPQSKKIDFASDENPIKETARLMISMTSDINTKYLGQLGDRRYAEPLTCGTCHRGQVNPSAF